MRPSKLIVTLLISVLTFTTAHAATKEEKRVANATDVIDQLLRIPEQSIPPALLSRAYAVAVVPHVIKIGFGLGARRGKGVLVVRQDDGSWSNPAFITLTGGSFGFQIGAQSTDIILVFKTRKGVDGISSGKLTLGADASIAAGPVGRHTGVSTDITFKSEVYSYSRSRGLFAGIALEGAGVSMDRAANAAFYGSSKITPEQIFASSGNSAPAVANQFVQVLTAQTRRLPLQPSVSGEVASVSTTSESQPNVRTYGMPDPEEPATEDDGIPQK
ncbi:MAG: lipid-binding SYLF domain-containing protein [Woeseiaceae bacterium]|nr:lipid-binding SYLF domain-containing protein [Woeseiaceae bacterium]